jgi:hypothetical protein
MTLTVKTILFFVILIVAIVVSAVIDHLLDIDLPAGNMNTIFHKAMYVIIGSLLVHYLYVSGLVGAYK